MYCKNCGSEIAESSRFCNHCGSPVENIVQQEAPKPVMHSEPAASTASMDFETPVRRKPVFEEFQWNVSEYPDRNVVEKTEEINFNWNADPATISDGPARVVQPAVAVQEDFITGNDLEKEVFDQFVPEKSPQEMSAAERIDKFYTFNSKNEEFQKLINNEYQRVKTGNAIEHEMSQADALAAERFETRTADSSMEAFLEKEGIVKPYQPKAFESDVLERIEAQEAAREAARLEEEARLAAIEEARLAAEAEKKAAEEAQRKAAEEEARLRAEEEARIRAEAEAKARAEEEARLRAEADLKAAQEAAKIRAQQEARLAAEAEAQMKAEQERKQLETEEAQRQLEEKRRILAQEANQAVAAEEARRVLEHTARLRAEEEAKIRAAVAGLRSGAIFEPATIDAERDVQDAHEATKNQINEMAKARDEFFAEFENIQEEPTIEEKLVTGRETMLSSDEITRTRVIKKSDIAAGLNEATRVADVKPEPAAFDDDDFFNSLDEAAAMEPAQEAQPIDFKDVAQPADELEELLSQFEEVEPVQEPVLQEDPFAMAEEKFGLNDTVLMPQDESIAELPANDFDSYGNEVAAAADDFYEDGFYDEELDLSKKELKQRAKEQKRLEKEKAKEEKAAKKRAEKAEKDYIDDSAEFDGEADGGKGRVVLKVVLVLLIIILAVEVLGMGIRFLAPQSKAAEFIDNQLNKVIQLITGEETEYSVIAAQVRTEPMEDKTDLINAQIGQNKNGNIDSIVYSEDLAYNQETDGEISDLVLSTPMTVVEWGRDKKNYPVYYDEQVVGQIIAYESNKVELMNNGDEEVLGMLDPERGLYSETAALKGQKPSGKFKKLEIGEIRQAGTNYYVWVRETIGDTTTRKVYSMYPEKQFVMKMTACYVV